MKKCPLCGSVNRRLLYSSTLVRPDPTQNQYLCTSKSYGQHGPIYKCLDCDFVFIIDNTPVRSILKKYEQAKDPIYEREEKARIATFRRHLSTINKITKKGRLLDVGAYTGVFLSLAKDVGLSVEGIEPSGWAVGEAKKNGLSIKNGILKKGYFKPNSFDIVTMWDVVEHFTDPKDALEIAFSYLKPGGWLFMTTIDVESPAAKLLGQNWPWYMRMHRVYFSKSTMTKMLKMVKFTNINYQPHIRFISLGYLVSRSRRIEKILAKILKAARLNQLVVPFYIGDLFDVYAQKQK